MHIDVMYIYVSYRGKYCNMPSRLFIFMCIFYSIFSTGNEPTENIP